MEGRIREDWAFVADVARIGRAALHAAVVRHRLHVDPYAANLALGITSIVVLQAGVNMAVTVGLLPTKGLALPFLSYGGSALVANMIGMGILLSVARESA